MRPKAYYADREQTYVKHFFLDHYLESVAYHIGYWRRKFVYVDCLAGPWRSADDQLADTSFMIAIEKLRQVRAGLEKKGRRPEIRCIFVEKDPSSYGELQRAIKDTSDIECKAIHGDFLELVPSILDEIGRAFALFFIDPTGWTDIPMKGIAPILRHQGEVIINFMYDFINRALNMADERTEASLDRLFGSQDWRFLRGSRSREDDCLDYYCRRVQEEGQFDFTTSTRILKALADRTYFHLVYATRHPKGILEFREVERRAAPEQEAVRGEAKREDKVKRKGQLFLESYAEQEDSEALAALDQTRATRKIRARDRLLSVLMSAGAMEYEQLAARILQIPLVWESDLRQMLSELQRSGSIEVRIAKPGQRVPHRGSTIVWAQR